MSKKANAKNLFSIIGSNALLVLSGILVGFFIPKILGVTEYGYYKTFTLYSSYSVFLLLGITHGIYLDYVGIQYCELPFRKFREITKVTFLLEGLFAFLIFSLSFVAFAQSKSLFLVFAFVAIHSFLTNMATYFQIISQVTFRFKDVAIKNVVSSVLTSLIVVVLFALFRYFGGKQFPFYIYCSLVILTDLVNLIWWMASSKDLIFGDKAHFQDIKKELLALLKSGLFLMAADFCNTFFFHLDRQFVNLYFSIEVFATYSFAYSILAMLTNFVSATSIVLYPSLKRMERSRIESRFNGLVQALSIVVSFCFLVFFPLCFLIFHFLPDYAAAIPIFQIMLPVLLPTSIINIVAFNYYKTLGDVKGYLFISCLALLISLGLDFLAYYTIGTPESVSGASVISSLVYYCAIMFYLSRKIHISWMKDFLFVLLAMSIFYFSTYCLSQVEAAGCYFAVWILLIWIFYPTFVKKGLNITRGLSI